MKMDNNTPETDRCLRKLKIWITRKCYLKTKLRKSIHYEIDVNKISSKITGDVV